ncbi:concanavalin A-like lectin/glucanase [Clavulina sp. PMI_390]|nr:concanavalin A-like lectin/glucanase [Clavulina sp. PMI_390]
MLASTLVALLVSTTALAAPKGGLAERVARRAGGIHKSRPLKLIESPAAASSNTSHVQYSSNWSGAVLVANTATYKSVTATFTVPTPAKPSGGSSSTTYSASAWVGIDGDTCGNAILQTGLDFSVQGTSVSYDAWYEWYPDYAYDFSGISFSAGDSVTITVTATSTKAGSAVIKNNTTGKSVSKSLTSTYALCETNAEWCVQYCPHH